jgi:hypothetical protein
MGESFRGDELRFSDSGYSDWRVDEYRPKLSITAALAKHRTQLALALELILWLAHLSRVRGAA